MSNSHIVFVVLCCHVMYDMLKINFICFLCTSFILHLFNFFSLLISLDGYLPADLFGDLPFYGGLSLSYTIVGAIWLLSCFCYRLSYMSLLFYVYQKLPVSNFVNKLYALRSMHK